MSKKKSSKSKKWTKKEDKIVIEMNLAGASHAEIAATLNRTYNAVAQRVHNLRKLKAKPSPKQVKPAAVKVAEKVLKSDKNKTKKPNEDLKQLMTNAVSAVLDLSMKLSLYAEMLEKQNAQLKEKLAEIEKITKK